jgi:Dimerisation domain
MELDIAAERTELRRLVNGFQASQALHVVASLGIPDLLAGGPCSTDDLAARTGSHAGALYRVLRAVAPSGSCTAPTSGRTAQRGRASRRSSAAP